MKNLKKMFHVEQKKSGQNENSVRSLMGLIYH